MLKSKRFFSLTGIAVLFACGFACAQEGTTKTLDPKTQASQSDASTTKVISQADILKLSEAFGHFIGRNLKSPTVNFDLESIIKGMRDGYAGKPAPLSDKEYEDMMSKMQEQAYTQLAATNLKAAQEFMANNAKADKVIEIEPGKLQYTILSNGQGAVVMEHFTPQIKYSGKFLDGTTFGSSEEVGGSITLPLDQTIPGFSKGILGMKEGEKRRLYVHPDLGYGTTGHLPPNALLIFDIEVLKANAPTANADDEEDLTEFSLHDEDADDSLEDDDEDADEDDMPRPTKPKA